MQKMRRSVRKVASALLVLAMLLALASGIAAAPRAAGVEQKVAFLAIGGKSAMRNAQRSGRVRVMIYDEDLEVTVEVHRTKDGKSELLGTGEKVDNHVKNMYVVDLNERNLETGAYQITVTPKAGSGLAANSQVLYIPKD